MGVVFKQSFQNTLITFAGFAIGALNTLVLYVQFMSDEYYGLVGVILSTATLLAPLLALGIPNTLVKYYALYAKSEEYNGFLSLMIFLPLLIILPLWGLSAGVNDVIAAFLARKNPIVQNYVWYIFICGIAMAYFEIFFSLSKVQLKSVFGTFMKEVFVRLGILIFLILLALERITVDQFLFLLIAIHVIRTLIMGIASLGNRSFRPVIRIPKASKAIFNYAVWIILGGSVAVVLLEIDRFMINQFIQIENVAYYTVAVFVVTTIAVPQRSMHQITYPLTARLMNENDMDALGILYKKSSQTLLVISLGISLLILLNLEDFYALLPESYRGGAGVVLILALIKIYDSFLGINSSILYNSKYYKILLILGVILAVLTIVFNIWLIPELGLPGAALATFLAVLLYNTAKLIVVKQKFNLVPWSPESLKVVMLAGFTAVLFYVLEFSFHPVVNIGLKSLLIGLFYMGSIYRFGWSEDINGVIRRYLNR